MLFFNTSITANNSFHIRLQIFLKRLPLYFCIVGTNDFGATRAARHRLLPPNRSISRGNCIWEGLGLGGTDPARLGSLVDWQYLLGGETKLEGLLLPSCFIIYTEIQDQHKLHRIMIFFPFFQA